MIARPEKEPALPIRIVEAAIEKTVAFLAFPELQALDLVGPLQVFATANEVVSETAERLAPYRLIVFSRVGGMVRSSSGLKLETASLTSLPDQIDTLIIAGGAGVEQVALDMVLLDWIKARKDSVRRLCSVCTGAFVLAAAGALDGLRAVTHWGSCERLQQDYPKLRVEPDALFVRDGNVWTSAGVTAGIDLALSLIEDDVGISVSMEVAKRLVVFLKRHGGQSQFSRTLRLQTSNNPRFERLIAWISDNLSSDLRLEQLAAVVGMAPRSFSRHFRHHVGITPGRAVELVRIDAARSLLESSDMPVKAVAAVCGFGNLERMRRAFTRAFGTSPAQYRASFGMLSPSGLLAENEA